MQEVAGDVWDFCNRGWIVLPIHIALNSHNQLAQCAGISVQILEKIPHAHALVYGMIMSSGCEFQIQIIHRPLSSRFGYIFFPTREFGISKGTKSIIENSLRQLVDAPIRGDIYLPLIGCGFSGMAEDTVRPLLEQYLDEDRFILVRRSVEVIERYPDSFQDKMVAYDYSLDDAERKLLGLQTKKKKP